jgi:hypothetical protein
MVMSAVARQDTERVRSVSASNFQSTAGRQSGAPTYRLDDLAAFADQGSRHLDINLKATAPVLSMATLNGSARVRRS